MRQLQERPVPAHPKHMSNQMGVISRKLVVTRSGNPDLTAVTSAAGGSSGQQAQGGGGCIPHRGLDPQGGGGSQAGVRVNEGAGV